MAIPVSGKTYFFTCVGASTRVLNLYYPDSIANGQNVCLWSADGSLEQQWLYKNSKLLSARNNSYALDKYTVSGNANNNNADVWTADDDDNQKITFESVSGNTVRIKLTKSGLYLTAYSNANGSASGKTPTSAGNVYWAAGNSSNNLQKWTFKEVSAGNLGNGELTVGERPTTLDYIGGCYTRFSAGQCTWHAFGRAKEVKGKTITFSQASDLHGKNWWKYVTNCTKTSTPTSNSIAVWDDGKIYGHVGYVEKVSGSNVYLTEANWAGEDGIVDAEDGKVRLLTTTEMKKRGSSGTYELLGYLVL